VLQREREIKRERERERERKISNKQRTLEEISRTYRGGGAGARVDDGELLVAGCDGEEAAVVVPRRALHCIVHCAYAKDVTGEIEVEERL
jgi:hypothetical protein